MCRKLERTCNNIKKSAREVAVFGEVLAFLSKIITKSADYLRILAEWESEVREARSPPLIFF